MQIYANKHFNYSKGNPRSSAKQGIKDILSANAELIIIPNIHNKTLWMDNMFLVEGSFNWLSAVRDKTNQYHNYESSLVYRGGNTAEIIAELESELKCMQSTLPNIES